MKRMSLLIALVLFINSVQAQILKKTAVGSSGCSAYTYCPLNFTLTYSQDSSAVYVAECLNSETYYGIICVKLLETSKDLEVAEQLLISYMDYLKSSFNVTAAVGYGKGHRLKDSEATRGVLDYWEDGEKNNWKVKGWTNGKFIAVLYGYSQKELPENKVNLFLDGFRFPGM